MSESYDFGMEAEAKACQHIENKGYKIIKKNYRYKRKEIDIIAQKDETIVFAEVKARGGFMHQRPEQAVQKPKQRHIIEAADYFLRVNEIELEARFDIISIENHNNSWKIKHIENAFQA